MSSPQKPQENSLKAKRTRQQARQRLQNAINTMQKSMYSLECLLEQFDETTLDEERAIFLNRAIAHLVLTAQPNFRIELLAQSQAELAILGA